MYIPRESCSKRVSLESLYGMCLDLPSTSADMTLPYAESDRLIFVASLSRSPVAPIKYKEMEFLQVNTDHKHTHDTNIKRCGTIL